MIKRFFSPIPKLYTIKNYKTSKKHLEENSLTIIPSHNSLNLTLPTHRHKIYSDFLTSQHVEMVFSIGPAGTGKTFLACQEAINQLKKKQVEKIIITRPMVCNDEELGFLPGNIESKMDPWTRPIFDIFQQHFPISQLQKMTSERKIECSPLAYMRGRTFNNSFIIGDEMQNATDNQMKMFLTRLGKNSKMVVTGDIEQIDSAIGDNSGLFLFWERYLSKSRELLLNDGFFDNNLNHSLSAIDLLNNIINQNENPIFQKIKWVQFQKTDIQRNPLISQILEIFNSETPQNYTYFQFDNNKRKII